MINQELLDALRAIVEEFPNPCPHPERDALSVSHVIKIAKAAIAKAEAKPTILIVLEGGLVRDIFCTHPLDAETDVFDLDVNDEDFTNENGDYMRAHLASGNVRRVTAESSEVEINTDRYPYVLTAEGPKSSKEEA